MPRYKLTIEYDGTPFSGWQIQDNAPTVQGALETAVKAICGEQVRVHGAGRTDAGVHALGQVAHCDIQKPFPPGRLRDGLNAHLRPHPIGVLSADIVPDDFEARFSAIKRHYRYRITNHRANLAVDIGRSWRVPRQLDTDAMHVAAQRLLGKHDFTTFRDTECQAKSPEKTLDQLDVMRDGDASEHRHLGALVPAQPGALDGGLTGLGRRRPLEPRRSLCSPGRAQPRRLRHRRSAGGIVSGAGGLLTVVIPREGGVSSTPRLPQMTETSRRTGSSAFADDDRSSEIPIQHAAINPRELFKIRHRRAFIDLMHGLADQAEFDHRAIARNETRVRGAAGG